MNWVEQKAKDVIDKYGTNDVYELCSILGIEVLTQPLGKKNSMVVSKAGVSVISVKPEAERWLKAYYIAHELGHYFCHDGKDPDLDDNISLPNKSKMEREADVFALGLLYLDKENVIDKGGTIESFSAATGLPKEIFREWRKNG